MDKATAIILIVAAALGVARELLGWWNDRQ